MASEKASSSGKVQSRESEFIRRGHYGSSPLSTATFVGLRALDPILQYHIIRPGGWGASLLANLGVATISSGVAVQTGIRAIDALGLSLPRWILLAMAAGSTAKQILWLTVLSNEEFPVPMAAMVSVYNTVMNSVNTLLFVAAATSASGASSALPRIAIPGTGITLPLPCALGALMYAVGISVETISEAQRKAFKSRPENKGKICRVGLWKVARHVNYAGYAVWRTGFALASGGWIPAALIMGWQAYQLLTSGVGNLDPYMTGKYGEQWEQYKRDVPWKMFPGIY